HLAADLGKGTHVPGPATMVGAKRLRALALTDNVPLMTAWANDSEYERVFAAQMENFIAAGDVAFGISGSGNSPNVLRALDLAREKRAKTVGRVRWAGGEMNALPACAIV